MNSLEILQEMKKSGKATGIDISKWNVEFDLDNPQGVSVQDVDEIVDFVALRATVCYGGSGYTEIDPKFEMFYEELEQHPDKIRIAYPFLNVSGSWTSQYGKFLRALDGKEFEILAPDAEHHYSYNDLSSPSVARLFAGITWNFTQQLKKDFPNKRVMEYTNRSTYRSFLRPYYPGFDDEDLWLASWAYSDWTNIPSSWLPGFRAYIEEVFTGERQPIVPATRPQNSWDFWQLGANTGLGEELGLGVDYLDVNVSRRNLGDLRTWSRLHDRWQPTPDDPTPPEELTLQSVDARLRVVEDKLNIR